MLEGYILLIVDFEPRGSCQVKNKQLPGYMLVSSISNTLREKMVLVFLKNRPKANSMPDSLVWNMNHSDLAKPR